MFLSGCVYMQLSFFATLAYQDCGGCESVGYHFLERAGCKHHTMHGPTFINFRTYHRPKNARYIPDHQEPTGYGQFRQGCTLKASSCQRSLLPRWLSSGNSVMYFSCTRTIGISCRKTGSSSAADSCAQRRPRGAEGHCFHPAEVCGYSDPSRTEVAETHTSARPVRDRTSRTILPRTCPDV